jgi:ATP-dependent Clp protease ATP-binding subunit ClpC
MIQLKGTQVAALAASREERNQRLMRLLRIVLMVTVVLSLFYDTGSVLGILEVNRVLSGLSLIFIGIGIFVAMLELYAAAIFKVMAPAIPLSERLQAAEWTTTTNLAEYVSFDLATALSESAKGATYDYAMFKEVLIRQSAAKTILVRAGLVGDLPASEAPTQAPSVRQPVTSLDNLFAYAAQQVVESKSERIDVSHILRAMAEHDQSFANILFEHHVEASDLSQAISWFERSEQLRMKHWFWQQGRVGSYGIGRDWAAGYTPTLSQYATDISKYLSDPALASRIVGRHAVVDQIITALSSEREANVLLIGLPGVGKKTLVNGVAAQISSGEVPSSLKDKHVMQLDVGQLLAGVKNQGELEARLLRVLTDAQRAGNIILFIDNLHTLLSADEGTVGSINAAALLLPALNSGAMQIIASSTPQDFSASIARQSSVAQAFKRIDVDEPSSEDTQTILQSIALHLEYRLGVLITMPVIRTVVADADRYLHKEPRPENAISLLEATATAAANRAEYIITPATVNSVVTEISKVPVGSVGEDEKGKLLNLETALHSKVIGQNEAVNAVAQALRRARSGLAGGKRPLGSFLFLGPTGVGKTETAKALAGAYFGAETAMLRFDMSEYQSAAALGQLIGSATEAQSGGSGQLTGQVRDKPFSLLLLDELEKAHPDVLNIFLQVLDDGHLTDGLGQKIDFTNTIIIATSNAGSEFIRVQVQAGKTSEQFQAELLNQLQAKGVFRPEFINRFDAVIAFHPLTPDELTQIVDLQLADLNKRLAEEGVTIALTSAAKTELAERGYQPEFGARALKRVMQTALEDIVANRLLAGTIQRGQTVTLDVADLAQ